MYSIYHSANFDGELSKFDKNFQDRVDKIEEQLLENPYKGDPLGVKWFREKRYNKYRIYFIMSRTLNRVREHPKVLREFKDFLIYEDLKSVFMVAISEKKDQQKVINTVRLMFDFLRKEIENLITKDKLT